MKKYLRNLPKDMQELISLISCTARAKKMSVYLVGGFVRDLLLGVDNFDLDIVVEGDGIALAEELSHILKAGFIRHHRFGTATLTLKNNIKIDIATARRESYPAPASLPEVVYASLKEDLIRRDFTINAMAVSLSKSDLGQLIDFYGGRADLKNKNIRILHDLSFKDDPTRMLRAIRFEQRLNFKIEPRTFKLLKEAVADKMLEKVQPQRTRDELILILKEEEPLPAIRRIHKLVSFKFISPKLALGNKTFHLLGALDFKISWYKKNYCQRRKLDAWVIYFMGLIDTLNLRDAQRACAKFVFRKGEEKRILGSKKISRTFLKTLNSRKIKPSQIYQMLEPLSYEVIIFIKAKYPRTLIKKHIVDFLEVLNGMRLCVGGEDLRKFGLSPGPRYEQIFAEVLKAKLEGQIKTKAQELNLIKRLI